MLKKLLVGSLLLAGSLYAGTINIAVAANVSYAIEDLKKEFNKLYPDTEVKVTLGSSGKLTAQIKNGAPYTLFMAANMKYPQALYADGIATTRPLVYAQGGLAMLSDSKKDFTKGIKLVKDSSINKIAVANPKTAPYGKAAVEAMKNGGVLDGIESKFVYAESISQTVSYAVTAADVGFIAKSSLYSPKMAAYKKDINWADVDPKLYTPINQGIVVLKNGEANSEVAAFYTFMLSQKAKKILTDFGYLVP
jgi:molybdate transport system substrate-binding protein